jgi:hypothetical protein
VTPIEKGRDWGRTAPVPDGAAWVGSDAEAADIVRSCRRDGAELPPLVLVGGDLARTLGARGDRARLERGDGTNVPIDLGAALIDGRLDWFIAHLIARRSWWRGRVVAVCNAAFVGPRNIAPRAHPGDGRLDVIDGDPSWGDRLRIRRRLASGSHLPHPRISSRQVTAMQFDLDPAVDVHLDGHRVGRCHALSVRVEPAALDVWI